jgi:hypothetical protein
MERSQPGRRLYFPAIQPATMVHKLAEGRYVVHLLTAPNPASPVLQRLGNDVTAAGRLVRLVPVSLWTGCTTCVRVWAGEFSSEREAEAFYRRMHPEDRA